MASLSMAGYMGGAGDQGPQVGNTSLHPPQDTTSRTNKAADDRVCHTGEAQVCPASLETERPNQQLSPAWCCLCFTAPAPEDQARHAIASQQMGGQQGFAELMEFSSGCAWGCRELLNAHSALYRPSFPSTFPHLP